MSLWMRVDVHYFNHPKVIQLPPLAQLLYLRAVGYSKLHLTDGVLSTPAIRSIACDLAASIPGADVLHTIDSWVDQMVEAGLFECTETGVAIHDFLEWNQSKQEVEYINELRREAGQRGGRLKANQKQNESKTKANQKQNESKTKANSKANEKQNESKQQSKTEPIVHSTELRVKEEDKTLVRWYEQAVEFWKAYPKKTGKGNVEKWFKNHKTSDDLFKQMLDKIAQMKLLHDWIKDGGKFIPMPSTWLNQKRWEDELPVPPARKCVL